MVPSRLTALRAALRPFAWGLFCLLMGVRIAVPSRASRDLLPDWLNLVIGSLLAVYGAVALVRARRQAAVQPDSVPHSG
jgi:hypothetical protein